MCVREWIEAKTPEELHERTMRCRNHLLLHQYQYQPTRTCVISSIAAAVASNNVAHLRHLHGQRLGIEPHGADVVPRPPLRAGGADGA